MEKELIELFESVKKAAEAGEEERCVDALNLLKNFPVNYQLLVSTQNEHLDTISTTESDEFIKSSVENLVPIPSKFEDFSDIKSECDMPDCDDSQTIKFSTFSNPLFDDSTSSDDESSHEEFDSLLEEFSGELAHTNLIPPGINEANYDPEEDIHLVERLMYYSDSERDNLSLERLLHDDPIPLSDILDFSNVVRVFLPFFTYPVISSILLSSWSENTIFDPGISDYHFSSFMPCASYRSGTFMKFIVYPNHLNESPMKILSSTCSPMDQ
uniref:Transcription elongation factor TFIIS n=1 Tax=Tanacetum cinerariifolium TaxID=118510 RepID=A0A6L2JTV8_TANCI|nr:transcription elongation factor TFIIS [Tanacetum cinerariifolium]